MNISKNNLEYDPEDFCFTMHMLFLIVVVTMTILSCTLSGRHRYTYLGEVQSFEMNKKVADEKTKYVETWRYYVTYVDNDGDTHIYKSNGVNDDHGHNGQPTRAIKAMNGTENKYFFRYRWYLYPVPWIIICIIMIIITLASGDIYNSPSIAGFLEVFISRLIYGESYILMILFLPICLIIWLFRLKPLAKFLGK